MSRSLRLGSLAAAVLVLVAAFIVLQPDDSSRAPQPEKAGQLEASPESDARPAATPERPPLLRAGRVRRIEVVKGDIVRLRVRSATAEEVHVHGYDRLAEVRPGATTRMRFRAGIEGVFEIELEHSGKQIGELRVVPR